MAYRDAFYTHADPQYFHNDTRCHIGAKVSKLERLVGDGRRRLCPECTALSASRPQDTPPDPPEMTAP